MDPLQKMISEEAARRGIGAFPAGSAFDPSGARPLADIRGGSGAIGGGIAPLSKPPATSPGHAVLNTVIGIIPRLGMINSVVNAGPVADGTLEHARRMGWVR